MDLHSGARLIRAVLFEVEIGPSPKKKTSLSPASRNFQEGFAPDLQFVWIVIAFLSLDTFFWLLSGGCPSFVFFFRFTPVPYRGLLFEIISPYCCCCLTLGFLHFNSAPPPSTPAFFFFPSWCVINCHRLIPISLITSKKIGRDLWDLITACSDVTQNHTRSPFFVGPLLYIRIFRVNLDDFRLSIEYTTLIDNGVAFASRRGAAESPPDSF